MRVGIVALLALSAAGASAEPAPPFEASGFIGVSYYGDNIGLGDSVPAEQRPHTAPAFGGRLTYLPVRRSLLSFGGELEASYAPARSGSVTETLGSRPAADTPVLSYRALLMLRFGTGWLEPFLEAGVGGATIITSSQYVQRDTDAAFVWGAGLAFAMTDSWQLRVDARQSWTESRDVGSTATYELLLGVGKRFGGGAKPASTRERLDLTTTTTVAVSLTDSDHDGSPDTVDRCPNEAGGASGCPEPDLDPDHDRDRVANDRCPDRAEDFDGFQDADGCPDDDNDADGLADANDKCPTQPETKNGIDDQDGCPDAMPPAMTAALQSASKLGFEPSRPRMQADTKPALDKAVRILLENPKLHLTVIIHPEDATDASKDLADKRADVVKWHLIDQGVSAKQLLTKVGAVTKAPTVELLLAP